MILAKNQKEIAQILASIQEIDAHMAKVSDDERRRGYLSCKYAKKVMINC